MFDSNSAQEKNEPQTSNTAIETQEAANPADSKGQKRQKGRGVSSFGRHTIRGNHLAPNVSEVMFCDCDP